MQAQENVELLANVAIGLRLPKPVTHFIPTDTAVADANVAGLSDADVATVSSAGA